MKNTTTTVLCVCEIQWFQLECYWPDQMNIQSGVIFPFSAMFCQLYYFEVWKMLLSHSRRTPNTEHGSLYIQHFDLKTEGNYQAQVSQGKNQQNAY